MCSSSFVYLLRVGGISFVTKGVSLQLRQLPRENPIDLEIPCRVKSLSFTHFELFEMLRDHISADLFPIDYV